jgi:tetratricopeptide (TPR) repeat protein
VPSVRSEFETLTWLPEAALPFFKGLDYYARGNRPLAIAWFRSAFARDPHFDQARLWEARACRELGFSALADSALVPVKPEARPTPTNRGSSPVLAVIGGETLPATGRAAFVRALAQSGRFNLFDPASIVATSREIDLQLTGQMAAPLNGRNVWLVVDSVVWIAPAGDARLMARQHDLLSGRLLRRVEVPLVGMTGEGAVAALAEAFLQTQPALVVPLSADNETEPTERAEPDGGDSPELAFAKALLLARAQPGRARPWIALSDSYSDWAARTWLLDQAIAAIDGDRGQPDAPFLLGSALWRKRKMVRYAWSYSRAAEYHENPLANDLAPLLEWFPNSDDARSASAEITRKAGLYTYSWPKDWRYLNGVYGGAVPPVPPPNAHFPTEPAVTDAQRQDRLDEYLREGRTALAWQVVNSLRTPDTASVRPQFRQIYETLLAAVLREDRDFQTFTNACAQKQNPRALELGQSLLHCALRQQRLEVIVKCGALLNTARGFLGQFEFVFTQAQQYRKDFLLDPVTGTPGENINYRLEGNPPVATRWTTHGTDYGFACVMGDLAETARARGRPNLAAQVFEVLRNDETLPLRNRLTAAHDLALMEHEQGRHFEALEMLKDALRQTEGTSLPVARKESWSSERIETLAFEALRKVRLYTGAEADVCGCCGEMPRALPSKPDNFDKMDRLLGELWKQTTGGVGADNRSVKQQLLECKDELLPVILYKLRHDQEVSHMLLFCGQLGTNAAVALPVIVQFVCHGERFEDYNNALWALGGIGKPAACAKPLLILAMEDSRSVFNAKYAMRRVGTAPRSAMPHLAQLLEHKNAAICEQAARAMVETVNLDMSALDGKSGGPLILALRQWWEEQGAKQEWED